MSSPNGEVPAGGASGTGLDALLNTDQTEWEQMQAQKLKFYIQSELQLSQEQLQTICTLVNAESVELCSEKQKGWGSVVVSEKTTVFADLKGKIDV